MSLSTQSAPPIQHATDAHRSPLTLHEVTASYIERDVRLQALTDVSFALAQHEFVALVGPSGSGKSTLLDIIAGLYPENEGEILLDGERLPPKQRLGNSAYMRQRDLLMPWRTALDNAALGLEVRGLARKNARSIAAERFEEFGLAGFEDSYPAQLSGGMRQRVAFLRTLLTDRELLLLDEPFGALDAMNRGALQSWLLQRWEEHPRTVLLVTHDVDEAVYLADRVLVMSPRPGTVVHEERVDLPRPRTRSMLATASFLAHRTRLLESLGLLDTPGGA